MGAESVRNRPRKIYLFLAIVSTFIFSAVLCFGILYGVNRALFKPAVEPEQPSEEPVVEPEPIVEPEAPYEADFQSVIDEWVNTVDGNKSIYIYDLDLGKVAGSYNLDENYGTASLYKLFVVYEGYKRVNNGEWNGDKRAGSTGYTISKCLDLAIRESHSPCAETLWSMIGHDTLDDIIENEWGIVDSDISKLTSNVSDIAKILKRFYEHPDFDDPEILASMWDSFLNQPDTDYEWRQGLPRGFKKANVYNKVGWEYNAGGKYWNIYHDAAIISFPLDNEKTRNYIVVVMTNKIDFKDIRRFGTMLEEKFYVE